MSSPVTYEVCVDSVEGALTAEEGGAQRVELCAGLLEGGTTPSLGLTERVVAAVGIPVIAMVRPRAGDFLVSQHELEVMERDIDLLLEAGVDGLVMGALLPDGGVDHEVLAQLIDAVGGRGEVVFHRAFDVCADRDAALETLVELGVQRLLTSGGAASALEGVAELQRLVSRAADRIEVMAGGGIRAANVLEIVTLSGVASVHGSALVDTDSAMEFRSQACRMGGTQVPGEFVRRVTSLEDVRALREALDRRA